MERIESKVYQNDNGRVIKLFCVVGLNEAKLTKHADEEEKTIYIQKIDVIAKNMGNKSDKLEYDNEKWVMINKNTNHWLRVEYTEIYDNPITSLRVIECEYESPENLVTVYLIYKLLNRSLVDAGYKPIVVVDASHDSENKCIQSEVNECQYYNEFYYKIPSICNVKEALNLNVTSKAAIIAISRVKTMVPIRNIKIITDKIGSFKFGVFQVKSPYTHKYIPEILDVYPLNSNVNPGIGMFCFPEGISIRNSDDLPKCFSFILTDEIGRRSYATCLIFTEELSDCLIKSFEPQYFIKNEKLYAEKAICIIGNYPFFNNYKIFLRELYRIQNSSNLEIPLERIICHFVDSIYFQANKTLQYQIAEKELKFYKQPIYAKEWDIDDDALEMLFISVSIENILILWEGLLLEKKIFLYSQSKTLLTNVCISLTSLLFPFNWNHVMIPILPKRLKAFIDSPVPLLIGLCYEVELSEFPADSIVFNLDKNTFINYLERLPKLPPKLWQNISKRLDKFKGKYNRTDDIYKIEFADEAFNYVGEMMETKEKFDSEEIREIFYEYFVLIFKNIDKYFKLKNLKIEEVITFNRDYFLKDYSSTDPGSFLYKFTETILFATFEDGIKENRNIGISQFFLECIKVEKKKEKFLCNKIPQVSTLVPEINRKNLPQEKYSYPYFPKLNPTLFNEIDYIKESDYYSKFEIAKDEWCYDLHTKKNNRDWAKFLIYRIHEIWFQLFSVVIPAYDDNIAIGLFEHAEFLFKNLTIKNKITPTRSLFPKLIRACGRQVLKSKLNYFLSLMMPNKKYLNPLNALIDGSYDAQLRIGVIKEKDVRKSSDLALNINQNHTNSKSNIFYNLRSSITGVINFDNSKSIENLIDTKIFVNYEFCPACYKNNKNNPNKFRYEQIIGGFKKDKNAYYCVCSSCLCKFFPKIYILFQDQNNINNFESVKLLSPQVLVKEIDKLIENHGEKYFFVSDYFNNEKHRQFFWNMVFYFELIGLPTFVLYIQNEEEKLKDLIENLESTRNDNNTKNRSKTFANGNTRLDSVNTEFFSRKQSAASNDVTSVFSGTIKSSTLSQHYNDHLKTIITRIIEKNESNFTFNPENLKNEEKNEIMNIIIELKSVI